MSFSTGWLHLDRGRFAIDPHRKHLCNRCHRNFWAEAQTISNPAVAVQLLPGVGAPAPPVPATSHADLRSAELGGVAIWASNPAVFWTFERPEVEGIHVHAWAPDGRMVHDETYGSVTLDGVSIDADQLRLLMVQRLVLKPSEVVALPCVSCGRPIADVGLAALHPANSKTCSGCGHTFNTPRRRRVVCNPLVDLLQVLGLH